MLSAFLAALSKDCRLLVRDRTGLIFMALAPVIVITVAGFSLASLYGADPTGQTAYLLPLADEDGGAIGRALADALEDVDAVDLVRIASRAEAEAIVRAQRAGTAVVVAAGASRKVEEGEEATILLLTDPVKYLEVANVRAIVQEIRHAISTEARDRAAAALRDAGERMRGIERDVAEAGDAATRTIASVRADLGEERRRLTLEMERTVRQAEREARTMLARVQLAAIEARARLVAELLPLRGFLTDLERTQAEFETWLATAAERAGRFANRLPAPPAPPHVPAGIRALADRSPEELAAELVPEIDLRLPRLSLPELPPIPELRPPAAPAIPEITIAPLPGSLEIEETSVTGAPRRLNTFDQNVPGFSVTFLLLGMLLGVSLGLLDERDWGTLARLRSMPVPLTTTLVAKLCVRFAAGVVQMVALLLVGWLAFDVSLGPQPWALLLPTVGIVFAGTAFGLIVAGLAPTREAVLPLGSIVIVTMAAVGGCWWPIDLEPRWMRQIALAFPTTWAMSAYNDLMIRRQTVEAVLWPTTVMVAYGAAYLAVGLTLVHRRLRG